MAAELLLRRCGALAGPIPTVRKGGGVALQVFVRTVGGELIAAEVEPDGTVADVLKSAGFASEQQLYTVQWEGRDLQPEEPLSDIGVCAEATLQLVEALCPYTWDDSVGRTNQTSDDQYDQSPEYYTEQSSQSWTEAVVPAHWRVESDKRTVSKVDNPEYTCCMIASPATEKGTVRFRVTLISAPDWASCTGGQRQYDGIGLFDSNSLGGDAYICVHGARLRPWDGALLHGTTQRDSMSSPMHVGDTVEVLWESENPGTVTFTLKGETKSIEWGSDHGAVRPAVQAESLGYTFRLH
eukprot:TRINITY_DN27797_c0_g1_i1.p1 TRINITY_DN27797_c0_g1~~TRINITY_DN27797_c0_g1_i1.p1  ORF type:complete len:296 (+),score=78.92 TRINITY_DN27797_c0_g1_i1:77-964(+)